MIHEEKKVAKIVEELTMYFFAVGADKMESSIERRDNQVVISFCSNYLAEYREKLGSLEHYLNEPHNSGVEDIYWELAGSGDPGETSQLLLIGMMVDKAEIRFEGDLVKLVLYKELLVR